MQVIRTIALQAANVTSQQIREQIAWFYLRHMDMDENVNPTTAFHALLTRKERESLPEPQGEKEKEVRSQLCTRSALFQAQLYDTISAYTKQFVMSSKTIPEELRSGLNADLAAFNEKTIQEFIDKLTACVRQNKTADQVAAELLAAWNKAVKYLADQIDRAYTQVSWYSLLRYWEKEGFSKFQYVVEQKEGLCGSCLSLGSKALTLKELLQQKLLPPLHPHCRCAILTAFGHGVSLPRIQPKPDSASQETAEDDADWYDALLRIPSDAKALLDSFVAAQQERLGRGTLGGFLDWLTMGMVSGSYQGLKARADAVQNEPSGYHILNWLTVGTADTVKGALAPDEPLSLEHWLNSLALVSIAAGSYELARRYVPSMIDDVAAFEKAAKADHPLSHHRGDSEPDVVPEVDRSKLVVRDPKYLREDGGIDWEKYAPNNGFVAGTEHTETLEAGTLIDRYGPSSGEFTAPIGTPYEQRSLPYHKNPYAYHVYRVIKPIEQVQTGAIAPGFDQPGGGIQHHLPMTVGDLLGEYLEEVIQ